MSPAGAVGGEGCPWGAAVLFAVAGSCAFLFIANRVLIRMRDSRFKRPAILVSFVLLTGGAALIGFRVGFVPYGIGPAAVLAALGVGELRRLRLRRLCRGSDSVRSVSRRLSLAQPVTTTDLTVVYYEVDCGSWAGRPFRVAHVSDLHVAATLPIDYYGQVMDAARDSGPDFLFVTGDFVTRTRHASLLSRVLKPVGKMGSFAILGNHDHWEGPDEVTQVVEGAGFTMLHNRAEAVRLGGGQVLVAGCEDPWATHPWEPPRPNPGDWFVVLTHTADNIYRLNRAGANAVFAGHYHAGQFRVPGLGALVIPSAYGRRFDHGHFVVRGTHLFVSAGVGSAVPPVRIYCAPDLFVVDFKPGATARKEPHAGGGT